MASEAGVEGHDVHELELSAGPLGVSIAEGFNRRRVCVVDVKNAASSPLREGDFIISMNNIIFAGRSFDECVAIIRENLTRSRRMVIHRPKIFVYVEGAVVPDYVVRARVDPSVTVIPAEAFRDRVQLMEVQLPEGLLEIGEKTFHGCNLSWKMKLPSTLKVIGN